MLPALVGSSIAAINITILECKYFYTEAAKAVRDAINITILECKYFF